MIRLTGKVSRKVTYMSLLISLFPLIVKRPNSQLIVQFTDSPVGLLY
jgi:hypothetical protein